VPGTTELMWSVIWYMKTGARACEALRSAMAIEPAPANAALSMATTISLGEASGRDCR